MRRMSMLASLSHDAQSLEHNIAKYKEESEKVCKRPR
jgi:hypothetical protein